MGNFMSNIILFFYQSYIMLTSCIGIKHQKLIYNNIELECIEKLRCIARVYLE